MRFGIAVCALGFLGSLSCTKDAKTEESGNGSEPTGSVFVMGQPVQNTGTTSSTTIEALPDDSLAGGVDGTPSEGDLAAVAAAKAALSFVDFAGDNTDVTLIKTALALPSVYLDTSVSWSASTTHVASDGAVSRPAFGTGNAAVSLTATIRKGFAEDAAVFALIIVQAEPSDQEAVAAALALVTESSVKKANDSLLRVTGSLDLATSGVHGTTLVWATTVNAIATPTGLVTRPATSAVSVDGTLTATVTRGSVHANKVFDVRVLKIPPELMITELFAGAGGDQYDSWIEFHNTTAGDLELSNYSLRTCDDTDDCLADYFDVLPTFTLHAGAYVTMHFGDASDPSGEWQNSDRDVIGLVAYFRNKNSYAEVRTNAAPATVDFVRWRDPAYASGAMETRSPLSGSFSGFASMPAATPGSSLQRKFPYDDTDAGSDWSWGTTATPGFTNAASASATDTDADGLTDAYETSVSHTDPTKFDTDGDWFSDGQEVLITGAFGINLKALGADPLVRDIFVEIDWMKQPAASTNSLNDSTGNATALPLRRAALDRVVAIFDAYVPDDDDNGATKIKIHFDAGSLYSGSATIDPAQYNLGGGNEIDFKRCVYLGVSGTDGGAVARTTSNCANLYAIKATNFDQARRYIFHYLIVGWSQETDGADASSGVAENPGNDLIMTVGSWNTGGSFPEGYIVNIQAATILHELGHNLKLDHGGDEAMNYKPNYTSTMNYLYQIDGIDSLDDGKVWYTVFDDYAFSDARGYTLNDYVSRISAADQPMNYSYGRRRTLNEASLDETVGWSPSAGHPIDFDLSSTITANVQANIQPTSENTSSTDVLRDHDDWKHLDLAFQESVQTYRNGVGPHGFSLDDADAASDEQPLTLTPCLPRKGLRFDR